MCVVCLKSICKENKEEEVLNLDVKRLLFALLSDVYFDRRQRFFNDGVRETKGKQHVGDFILSIENRWFS
jgi:hypothetical protein